MTVRLHWNLKARASLFATWALLSDTDRFNRAAGMGFQYREKRQADGSSLRLGKLRKFGLTLNWEEPPFEFEVPSWFRSRRKFHNGPVATVVTTLQLSASAEATLISYTVELEPRNIAAAPLVQIDATLTLRPQLLRTLRNAIKILERDSPGYDPPAPPLSDAAEMRLAQVMAQLPQQKLSRLLGTHIRHAPLWMLDRMQPLRLAEQWEIPEEDAILSFLGAVRGGVLTLSWEIMCPSCRGPKSTLDRFNGGTQEVHCPSCRVTFDGTFPDSLQVTFRPVAEIRAFEVSAECVGSPQRTPHVVLAAGLMPGSTMERALTLEPGGYRISVDGVRGTSSIEVRENLRSRAISVDLTNEALHPAVLRVAPGQIRISLRSRLDRLGQLKIERRWQPEGALTAGRLLEVPAAHDILPRSALVPGLKVDVRRSAILAIEVLNPEAREETIAEIEQKSEVLHVANNVILAVFPGAEPLLSAARDLAGDPHLASGLAIGSVAFIETPGAVTIPSGGTVESAIRAARMAGAGHAAVPLRSWADSELDGSLAAWLERGAVHQSQPDAGIVPLKFKAAEERKRSRRKRLAASRNRETASPHVTIAGYQLREVLGEGGFGRVFAAWEEATGKEAVMKVLLPEVAADPDAVQLFYNEARLAGTIDHPNVVRVFDYGTNAVDGQLYIVMERLRGHELKEELRRGRLSPPRAARLLTGALSGLAEAQRLGIVHRDLKPANLFLVDDDHLKVIDFGLAVGIDGVEQLELDPETVLGTPEYMSPEQVEGESIDGRSDIYSMGLILYEALAGEQPFDGPNAVAVALERLVHPPRPLLLDDIPEAMKAVALRALSIEPDDRYPNADAMRVALEATSTPED